LAVDGWQLTVGSWQLTVGGWQLTVGGWRLAVGGWPSSEATAGKPDKKVMIFATFSFPRCNIPTHHKI